MSVESVMAVMFNIGVPLAILCALFGFRWREGLWGNTISAFCVVFSVFIAVAWWETLAATLSNAMPSGLFLWDLISIWAILLLCLAIFSELTRALSRIKVQFAIPIEAVGNVVSLAVLFVLVYGFFLFTMDLAPIGATNTEQAPADSKAIQAFRLLSKGTLEAFVNPHPFDAHGEFRRDHLLRRQALMRNAEAKDGSLFYEGTIPPRKKD